MEKHSASVVGPDPDGKYWITLEAGEIRASISVRSTGIVGQVMAAFAGQPALVPPQENSASVQPQRLPGIATKQEDLLVTLQRAIDRAEHAPGQWKEGLAAGGSIAFGEFGGLSPHNEIGTLGHRRDALLAIAAVNALPELLDRIRRTEQGERSADQEVERLQDELERLRNQLSGQAEAWVAVFKTIAECIPGAFDADGKTVDQACAAIRQLAAEAGRKAEARIDVIGQNGNTGEHYDELVELAIQQGGKPVDELPDGLTWDQAPEWADRLGLVGDAVEKFHVWFNDKRYQYVDEKIPFRFGDHSSFARERHEVTLIAARQAPAQRRDATQA